jgi:hypothetical protein
VPRLVKLLAVAGYDRCAGTPALVLAAQWSTSQRELRIYEDGVFLYTSGRRESRGALPQKEQAEIRRLAESFRETGGTGWLSYVPPHMEEVLLTLASQANTQIVAYVLDCSGLGKRADVEDYGPQVYKNITRLFAILKREGFDRCGQ